MLRINEEEFSQIIHDLLNIVRLLKGVENGNLTEGQRQIIQGIETRLSELRQQLVESVENEENDNG